MPLLGAAPARRERGAILLSTEQLAEAFALCCAALTERGDFLLGTERAEAARLGAAPVSRRERGAILISIEQKAEAFALCCAASWRCACS